MKTINQLSQRCGRLEQESTETPILTIERRAGVELIYWGTPLVKRLRGASIDDL